MKLSAQLPVYPSLQMMVNSLKLYADNLLCMDLCCCSGNSAMRLLGDQVGEHAADAHSPSLTSVWGLGLSAPAPHFTVKE